MADPGADGPHGVHPLLAARWSPRALDPAAVVADDAVRAVLEAARWAASYGDTQPSRFVVTRRGTDAFDALVATLTARNRTWVPAAGVLLLACAQRENRKGPLSHARFDLGQAVAQLQLQAVAEGLVAHVVGGFDPTAARSVLGVPAPYDPVVLVALGHLAGPGTAAPELEERDARERRRLPLDELAFDGRWGEPRG
ncbi:nitroreductase family protein [Rhodococcus aerolatus]